MTEAGIGNMASPFDSDSFERITGLVAFPPDRQSGASSQTLSKPLQQRLSETRILSDLAPFIRSGWQFEEKGSGLPVYRGGNGRIYIGGDTMNVKFSDTASAGDIDALLKRFHLAKRRSLGFATNLMTVTMDGDRHDDPFQLSKAMASDPAIDFAEPVLIEDIGGRIDGAQG